MSQHLKSGTYISSVIRALYHKCDLWLFESGMYISFEIVIESGLISQVRWLFVAEIEPISQFRVTCIYLKWDRCFIHGPISQARSVFKWEFDISSKISVSRFRVLYLIEWLNQVLYLQLVWKITLFCLKFHVVIIQLSFFCKDKT